jgi:hypothetical protein
MQSREEDALPSIKFFLCEAAKSLVCAKDIKGAYQVQLNNHRKAKMMYEPTTTRRTRDAIRAGHQARADAFAAFWAHVVPRRK